jgi:hypothetical protein
MDAALGALYNSDNSPKDSPGLYVWVYSYLSINYLEVRIICIFLKFFETVQLALIYNI